MKVEKLIYPYTPAYRWSVNIVSSRTPMKVTLDEVCDTCDSIKDKEIEQLKAENRKLKRLNEFYRNEVRELELKTALDSRAIPIEEIAEEFRNAPNGRQALENAWLQRQNEWSVLVKQGKMSKIKYQRLMKRMDQKTLSEKLAMAQPNISRIEKPGYNVPTKTLKKLAEIFGVKMEDLIGD